MKLIEHTESRTIELSREELRRLLLAFLPLPEDWLLDDAELQHCADNFTLTVFLSRPCKE